MEMSDFQQVIDFWFSELSPKDWFRKSDELDQRIQSDFADLHRAVAAGETWTWREDPWGRLAEVLVLDQFSRNMYRDTPAAFAADGMALIMAQAAVQAGDDKRLPEGPPRAFLYMPYMHSESSVVHEEAVKLFDQPGLEQNLEFEHKHKVIIDRFGRYPHRNEILGRPSTAEEEAFLQEPGSSF